MNYEELELAGIDVKELLCRLMNNETLVKMVIGKFLEDTTYEKLKAAVKDKDLQAAEFACHSLKGVCGNLALKKLFTLTQEQLKLFRGGEADAALAMMDEIDGSYGTASEHLRKWLAGI